MQRKRSNKGRGNYHGKRNNGRGGYNSNRRNTKNGISNSDISSFIQKSIEESNRLIEDVKIENAFTDFGFSKEIEKNLDYKGYKIPTLIQDQAIKPILEGRDLIGLANTGTGKTAAFLLPMLNKVHGNREEKVLIVTPTRELALQVESELHQFSYGMGISYVSCVGGMPIRKQINALTHKRPAFVIGTPGRIKDLENRGLIKLSSFNNVVLDEVDRMLDMGFVKEIKYFLDKLPRNRQSLYFSATIQPQIKSIIETFSVNPVTIQVISQKVSKNIKQELVHTNGQNKFEKLKGILSEPDAERVLIFSERKRDVEKLSNELASHGFKAESIHGNKKQSQRQRALNNFKSSKANVLVATDVAARGLDIKDVTHVINYTAPQTYDDYIHRIGRTGRGGASGKGLTFVG